MPTDTNEAGHSYWRQVFARQAESPWATLVDPDANHEEDRKTLKTGLLKAGWAKEIVEVLADERADIAHPSTGNSPGIANHVERNFDRLCDDVEAAIHKLGYKSHEQVVRGIDPVTGPSTAMSPVMMTNEVVISVSAFFSDIAVL